MSIGEKISLYKERLGFKNFADFSKAVGISGDWLLDMSKKKSDIKTVDLGNLIKLSEYLNIPIEQLVKDEDAILTEESARIEHENDIKYALNELEKRLNQDNNNLMFENKPMNKEAIKICSYGLQVVQQLIRQYQ